ncbi:hypothetical protein Aau02nite_79150 [Amorphoplanes auranticolor]|uniref:Uncharacterized protein n=1 Tax=Actinoplanes auranticolor TaxID=47988 RepID=A0A919SV57_9ACTN|nr:hypothetical protein Aau02nite_79150 [Actinoplanes auranticolor]
MGMPAGLDGAGPVGTELYGPLGAGVTVDTEPLGVTGTEVPGATGDPAEQAVRLVRTSNVAAAVRENEIMTHLRE